MKNHLCLCVLFLVLLVSAPFSFGQSYRANTLKGLKATRVLVESLSSDGRRTGLTVEQIKTDVELQLRKVGIRIDESADNYLYLNATILKIENRDGFVYHLSLAVQQQAILKRDSSISSTAATWEKGKTGITSAEKARNWIRDMIRDLVDDFLNDYLTVNPVTR